MHADGAQAAGAGGPTTRPAGPDSYLRQMGLSFRTDGSTATGTLACSPGLWPAGRRPRLGALAALADCVAGYRAVRDFDGAWLGTSELAVHGPFRDARDDVVAAAELLRRRRSGAVYEVTFGSGPDGPPLAEATVTLALLSRQGERKVPRNGGGARREAPEPLQSLGDLLELEETGAGDGGSQLRVTDGVRNSWGVVAGGIVTLVSEVEAERTAGLAEGRPCRVEGLGMHFLAPGRIGPIVARATLLTGSPSDGSAHLRVRIHDSGADDRLIATASATARPSGPREPVTAPEGRAR